MRSDISSLMVRFEFKFFSSSRTCNKIPPEVFPPPIRKRKNMLKTRHCTTVRNSDDKAIPLRWAHTQICILSTTAASFDQ